MRYTMTIEADMAGEPAKVEMYAPASRHVCDDAVAFVAQQRRVQSEDTTLLLAVALCVAKWRANDETSGWCEYFVDVDALTVKRRAGGMRGDR